MHGDLEPTTFIALFDFQKEKGSARVCFFLQFFFFVTRLTELELSLKKGEELTILNAGKICVFDLFLLNLILKITLNGSGAATRKVKKFSCSSCFSCFSCSSLFFFVLLCSCSSCSSCFSCIIQASKGTVLVFSLEKSINR